MTTAIATKTIDYPGLAADSRQMRIIEANLEGELILRGFHQAAVVGTGDG